MENSVPESIKIEPATEPKKENESQSVTVPIKEKRNGKEEKSRKKDDRSIEQILKGLSNIETPEGKLSVMCKKYIEILDENRKLQSTLKLTEKKVLMIQRENEQYQSEKSKAVLTRSRLESLCRELQRQNKAVKEESLLKIREEEEKRKEVSAKFQSTLAEITALMAETNEKNVKLHEDNIEIHKKFKSVFDEMDIREQHFEGMHQMMKHELQVAEAKLAKVTLEMTEEKESLLKEKNTLLLKLTEYQAKIRELQQVEVNLRSQINMYTDKYDEFQSALTKSNEVFGGFNEEMEKMSKKILKLEKETNLWKMRWEKSHAALLDMASDKQIRDSEIATLNRKCSLLQELCKAFQQERATLLTQLKEKSENLDPEVQKEIKADDNQKQNESVTNTAENLITNGSTLLYTLSAKLEEETKEQKTETCSIIKENVNEPSTDVQNSNAPLDIELNTNKENIENVGNQTVNRENKEKILETVLVKAEKNIPTVSDINETIKEGDSLKCDKEDISKVPIEATDSSQIETIAFNTEQSTKSLEIEEIKNANIENTSDTILNNTNLNESNKEPQICVKSENNVEEPTISEDAPKVKNNTDSEDTLKVKNNTDSEDACKTKNSTDSEDALKVKNNIDNAVIPNGEIHSNHAVNKKHKEGKKKKK